MSTPGNLGFPHEVLTAVLEHLPQKALRNASQVSRGFYSSAHDAGLTLRHTVNTFKSHTLDTFAHVVTHAEAQPQRFRLALSLVVYRRNGDSYGLPSWDDIWSTVRRAMPFLVSLHIILYPDVMQDVFAGLDAPAPYLRVFTVDAIDMDGRFPSVQPPASLFGGSAPRLRRVELNGPALLPSGARVPAWRGVRELRTVLNVPGQPVDVARFFPALRELVLTVCYSIDDVAHVVDLSGLTLDALTIRNDTDAPIQYTSSPARVGVLKDLGPAARCDSALWPDFGDEQALTARIYQNTNGCAQHDCEVIDVAGETARYEHYAIPDAARERYWQRSALGALETLAPLRARLVSLTIDDAMIARLLRTDSTLAALRDLFVACTPPPSPPASSAPRAPKIGRVALCCPALERITLFTDQENSAAVSVGRERIAPLSALRPVELKSVLLVLARVSVDDDNMDGPLLGDVFSKVCVVEEDCAPAYYHQHEENARCAYGLDCGM